MKIRSAREYDRSKEGRKERRDAEKERKRRGEMAEAEQQEQ